MNYHLRWIIPLLANMFLVTLLAEINHYLAPFALQIFLGGLLLTFGVLRLNLRQSFLVSGITALFLDATNPLPFGYTFFLYLTCHTIVFSIRGQFARETLRSNLFVALLLNLVLFLGLSLAAARGVPAQTVFWGRLVADSSLSVLALLLIAPWYLSLQNTALALIGIDLDAEQREAQ